MGGTVYLYGGLFWFLVMVFGGLLFLDGLWEDHEVNKAMKERERQRRLGGRYPANDFRYPPKRFKEMDRAERRAFRLMERQNSIRRQEGRRALTQDEWIHKEWQPSGS
jgi:hypothetical protein